MTDNNGKHANDLPQGGMPVVPDGPSPTPPTVTPPAQTNQQAVPPQAPSVPPNWQPVSGTSGTSAPRKPRPKTWLIVAIVAAVVISGASITTVMVLNHRADVAAQERRDEADRKEAAERAAQEQAAKEARQEAEEKAAAELAAARSTFDGCTRQLDPLLDALQTVDARLNVGLTQSDMSGLVGRVSIAYNRMDVDELGVGTCLRAAVQLENAFNSYNRTVSQWNDCIFDYYCDTDDIMPGMQGKWFRASGAIGRAADLLDSLDPDSPDYGPDTSGNSA